MLPECESPFSKTERARWARRILALSIGIGVVILAASWVGKQFPLRSPLRVAMALVQGAATAVLVVAIARPIRQYDELQQRIQLEALALAFGGTAILTSSYGFLVKAGLPDIDWSTWTWPAMVVLWALGQMIASRRYR